MENTMLIIDDTKLNRDILKLLFDEKYIVLEAESAEEGMAIVERCQGNVDIILLDLIMPGMSGFDLLEQRREIAYFKDIPVVVITSSGAMEDQVRAFDLGANDFVNKPFIPEIVCSRVDNVMASHRRMLSVELEAQKLKVKSELDQMTGLYNKVTSEVMINEILKSHATLNVLMVIDIDNFKSVNDTSGHLAGDHVIKIVADLISSLFRKTDIVGRIGGDEFIVAMVDVPDLDVAREKVNELIQIMKYKPNLTIPENVTLSIGMVSNDGKETNYADLFARADEALFLAKEEGKARYVEYGVERIDKKDDHRPTVLLISRNRSICSIVQSLVPTDIRVIEVISVENLSLLTTEDIERMQIVYADTSDCKETVEEFWKELKNCEWMDMNKVFAICQEGNIEQLAEAVKNQVCEVLMAPLDTAAFKRRTHNKLAEAGIMKRQKHSEIIQKKDGSDDME